MNSGVQIILAEPTHWCLLYHCIPAVMKESRENKLSSKRTKSKEKEQRNNSVWRKGNKILKDHFQISLQFVAKETTVHTHSGEINKHRQHCWKNNLSSHILEIMFFFHGDNAQIWGVCVIYLFLEHLFKKTNKKKWSASKVTDPSLQGVVGEVLQQLLK